MDENAAPLVEDGGKMDMGTMNQYFVTSSTYRHLLFYNLSLKSHADLALMIVLIFILSALMQLMKMLRDILKQHLVNENLLKKTFKVVEEEKVVKKRIRLADIEEEAEEGEEEAPEPTTSSSNLISSARHSVTARRRCPNFALKMAIRAVSTILHMLQLFIAYILMFLAMTYNVWIFIAIIAAQTLSYFLVMPYLGASLI